MAQHCTYGDRGIRNVTCFRLNSPYLSRVTGIQTSKYLYDSFKCVNCNLGTIQPNSFNVGSSEKSFFRSMDLEASGITEIKLHGFGYQGQVRSLVLRRNQIKFLYASNFVDLTYLEYLDVSTNFIQKLSTNTFQGLNYLKILILENNNITSIDNYAFRDLEELQLLNLKRNRLTTLRYGMFFGASNVNSLYFSSNLISSLDSQALTSLASLDKLDLSNNHLTNMSSELLAIIKQLKAIDLSYNNFSAITFSSDTLEELKLSNISLQRIEVQLKCSLPSLTVLDLQKNNISTFSVEYFSQFPVLTSLNLSENSISGINTSGKLQMRSLQTLDLSFNNLTSFDYLEFLDYTPQLKYMNLKKNPLICYFENKMKKFFETSSVRIHTSQECSTDFRETVATTELSMIQNIIQNDTTNDFMATKECRCSCDNLEKGILTVVVVILVLIFIHLLFTLCLQCCCVPNQNKYAVSSTSLPLVNLSKE